MHYRRPNGKVARSGVRRKVLIASLGLGICNLAFAGVLLTSVTLDPESAVGQTTNTPGAFSTNSADPLRQIGVMSGGVFLNNPGSGFDLGEISILLQPGLNTLSLFGDGVFPNNAFYGAILFFDGSKTPQIAVYNSNGGAGAFSVQPAGATVIGSASGGSFFDTAPGSDIYAAPDGSAVQVVGFTVASTPDGPDLVSAVNIGANGVPDTTGLLTLNYTPIPEPSNLLLLSAALAVLISVGAKKRSRI